MIILLAMIVAFTGCDNDEMDFSEDYDIPWIVSKITNMEPLEGTPGTNITITGENLGSDLVPADGFWLGTDNKFIIISQTETNVIVQVPTGLLNSEPMEVSVHNLHNRTFVYTEKFKPILPE